MKAIVNTAPGRLEWLDWPTPEPGPGQVRIRAGAVGICATDVEMISGWERTGFPAIPGHEWSGTVDAAGPGVDPALVGARCVAENSLTDGGEVGFEHPGAYGHFFLTEAAKVQQLPEEMPFATAALIEPLAVCVRALRRLTGCTERMPPPAPVLILGDGPIGLLCVLLLTHSGCGDITVLGGRASRLDLARGFGAQRILNYHRLGENLAQGVRSAARSSFRTLIEASGAARALETALDLAGREADILVIGDYGQARAGFAWNLLLHQELRLIGSNASAGAWPMAMEMASAHQTELSRLITRRLPADRYEAGFDLVRRRSSDVVKVVLEWPERPKFD